jgi:hypothetical protein
LKRFQIINHRRNYFRWLTLFCIAIHGGAVEGRASPGGVARRWRPRKISGRNAVASSPEAGRKQWNDDLPPSLM